MPRHLSLEEAQARARRPGRDVRSIIISMLDEKLHIMMRACGLAGRAFFAGGSGLGGGGTGGNSPTGLPELDLLGGTTGAPIEFGSLPLNFSMSSIAKEGSAPSCAEISSWCESCTAYIPVQTTF